MKKALLSLTAAVLALSASVAAAPAPALTYLQIRYVGSSNQGWEPISDSQFSTALDHGGAQLRALTVELGYGSAPVAFMNGAVLPSTKNYSTVPFCTATNFLAPCQPGQVIIGFVRYWNLDGYQNGTFAYRNTSTNSPFNTMSDSLSIR